MNIHVTLAGPLSKYGNGSRKQRVQAGQSWTLEDLLVALDIPEEKYSFVIINGQKSEKYNKLNDGDNVTIYPMVSGG